MFGIRRKVPILNCRFLVRQVSALRLALWSIFITNPLGNLSNGDYRKYSRAAQVAAGGLGKGANTGQRLMLFYTTAPTVMPNHGYFTCKTGILHWAAPTRPSIDEAYFDPYEDIYAE